MAEKIEVLNKKEYDTIGKMLIELMEECPYVPESLKDSVTGIMYDNVGSEKGIFILTDGGRRKKKYVSGTLIAEVNMRISYQTAATSDNLRINAQETVNKIINWLSDLANLPKLTGGRKITKFEAFPFSAVRYETTKDGYVAYTAPVIMECEMKGE